MWCEEFRMGCYIERYVLDCGGDAQAADLGGVFGEDEEFAEGDYVGVCGLGGEKVGAAFGVLLLARVR